jgi:Ca-activated chloride channel family protein
MSTHAQVDLFASRSSGGRLVSVDGRALPLRDATLRADARGGIARVTVAQRFENPYDTPLHVTYSLPLPADGAVSGFCFTAGERRIVGEIDRRDSARERFEQAIVEGRTAAILEQDRTSLFTQEIGNVPPRASVVAEIVVDQRLRWLDEGAWEWRFPTVVAPRYLGIEGRVPDAARVTQDVADGPTGVTLRVALAIRDALPAGARVESPSHALHESAQPGRTEVVLAGDAARLDRDVVVRWSTAAAETSLGLDLGASGTPGARAVYGLLTLVPPRPDALAAEHALPRDLIVLLDTSGSMHGRPLEQARRIAGALVESLGEDDQLEMIEFSTAPRRWQRGAVRATAAHKRAALDWLRRLESSGATEMRAGIYEALSPLRSEAQRQVVLITDGQIGFESEVVETILEHLPAGSRLHTVGVGSAVNRSLTGPAARAGRGVEVVIGVDEDVERATARLLARTRAPLVVDLVVAGSALIECVPRDLPDLFAGAPALLSLKLRPEGGEVVVRGRTAAGEWSQRVRVPEVSEGEGKRAVSALYGREAVEDCEMLIAGGAARGELDPVIERLGLELQIATRLTSWVAVSEEATVDATAPVRRERMPHELPHGMSMEGLGLRAASAMPGFRTVTRGIADSSDFFDLGETFQANESRMPRGARGRRPRGLPVPAESVPASERARRRLRGRRLVAKGRKLVLLVEVTGELAWRAEGEVEIVLKDGRRLRASVDPAATTRAGTIADGLVVRLSLDLPDEVAADVVAVELGEDLVIEVA